MSKGVRFGKRVDGLLGRRRAERVAMSLPASMFTIDHSRVVILAEVSATGAKMIGPALPTRVQPVRIKIGPVDTFGEVVWSAGNACGIRSDEPLEESEVSFLRRMRSR